MSDRNDLRALSDAATPGRWTASESTTAIYGNLESDGWDAVALTPCPKSPSRSARHRQWQADATFIAACVNYVREQIASGRLIAADDQGTERSYTDDDYRRLHAQLVDTQRQLDEARKREESAQAVLARIRKVRDDYASQARFADVEQASYFREFIRRLDKAAEAKLALTTEAAGRVVSDGWVVVPKMATAQQLAAGQTAWLADPMRKSSTLYAAMVEAAPSPPAPSEKGGR